MLDKEVRIQEDFSKFYSIVFPAGINDELVYMIYIDIVIVSSRPLFLPPTNVPFFYQVSIMHYDDMFGDCTI